MFISTYYIYIYIVYTQLYSNTHRCIYVKAVVQMYIFIHIHIHRCTDMCIYICM